MHLWKATNRKLRVSLVVSFFRLSLTVFKPLLNEIGSLRFIMWPTREFLIEHSDCKTKRKSRNSRPHMKSTNWYKLVHCFSLEFHLWQAINVNSVHIQTGERILLNFPSHIIPYPLTCRCIMTWYLRICPLLTSHWFALKASRYCCVQNCFGDIQLELSDCCLCTECDLTKENEFQ